VRLKANLDVWNGSGGCRDDAATTEAAFADIQKAAHGHACLLCFAGAFCGRERSPGDTPFKLQGGASYGVTWEEMGLAPWEELE